MANISETKRLANRENAKKSTGPKSIEGKGRAKFNALKHGLTAALAVPVELRDEADARVSKWLREMKPREGAEAWLVERAATDAVRVDAATRCERARLALRIQRDHLYTNADGISEVYVEGLGKQLLAGVQDNGATLVKLRGRWWGCDWLIARWDDLKRRHEAQGMWELREFTEAQRLMGGDYRADLMTSEMAFLCVDFLLSKECGFEMHEDVVHALHRARWKVEEFMGADDAPDAPESRDRANARLRNFINGKIADLVERRDTLAEAEACENALAAECLLMDTSAEGKLLHRYETELLRRVHQSVDQLAKLQKARAEVEFSARNEATEVETASISTIAPITTIGKIGESARNEATEVEPASIPTIGAAVPVTPIAAIGEVGESARNEATEVETVPVSTIGAVAAQPSTPGPELRSEPGRPGREGLRHSDPANGLTDTSAIRMLCGKSSRNGATEAETCVRQGIGATDREARGNTPERNLPGASQKEMDAFFAAPHPTFVPRQRVRQSQ